MFGIKESVATVVRHYKEGNLNWPMIIYISLAHAAALIGLFTLSQCHKYTLLWAFILWPIRYAIELTVPVASLTGHIPNISSLPISQWSWNYRRSSQIMGSQII